MKKKILRIFLKNLFIVLLIIVVKLTIDVGMEGMWFLGIPKPETVRSVTIEYPALSSGTKEITDREDVELCVNMARFLRYKPFAKVKEGEPLVTFCYHLENGEQVEVAANATEAFFKGKTYCLKDDDTFINVTEGIFFPEEAARKAPAAESMELYIDGVCYVNTGTAVPAEPDESAIEYVEIPVDGETSIKAFARIQEGKETYLLCLIDAEWYKFVAR